MNNNITYIELPVTDLEETKKFYGDLFGWTFQDWGDTYVSFHGAGIDGGFDATGERTPANSTLVIISSDDLEMTYREVKDAGARITKEIFSFPGGRRFEFEDPSGNGLAVWSHDTSN